MCLSNLPTIKSIIKVILLSGCYGRAIKYISKDNDKSQTKKQKIKNNLLITSNNFIIYNKIFNNKITNVECIFKKYIHNHPVSKLEKIIQKMNEKKLIIPTPEDNIKEIVNINKKHLLYIKNVKILKRITPDNINILTTSKKKKINYKNINIINRLRFKLNTIIITINKIKFLLINNKENINKIYGCLSTREPENFNLFSAVL